jgi:hypothetical protein
LILALLAACSGETPEDTASACADAPVMGWADVGQPLLLEYCDTCHTATSPQRQGAPEDVVFDTYEQVEALRVSMLYVLQSDPPVMPPLLTVPDNDQELMISWLSCDVGQ